MNVTGFGSRRAIREHQLSALRRLLDAIASSNSFYAPKLRRAGLDGNVSSLAAFFDAMPFTTKSDIVADQQKYPPFGSNLTFPVENYCRFYQTSGSTGTPIRWLDTTESWQWMLDNWKQVYRAAGVDAYDRLYFAFSFGPFLGFWTAFDAAAQLGCLSIPGGGASSRARLEAIRDNQATVLMCTPTYAMRLAEVAAEEKIPLEALDVRTIIVAGEPGGSVPATRARIEHRWPKATLFDHHGMTEVGPVSYQCPEKPGSLVIMEGSYVAEILDPNGNRPVPAGDTGELVLTTLGRLGSPLIRYRTGDLVREDTESAQAFGHYELTLQGGILGRTDDMVLVRGVNVYPSAIEEILRSFQEITEYRVEICQTGSMTEMQIGIEPGAGCTDGERLSKQVEAKLRSVFHLRVPVSVCAVGQLPRFEMKSRRWVRK
jgi:phenylacetate-CoA ligase